MADTRIGVEGRPRPHTSTLNVLTILLAGIASANYGFSVVVLGGSLSQPTFVAKFLQTPHADSIVAGMLGGFYGSAFLGALGGAPISKKYGRRAATGLAAVLLIFSSALMTGAANLPMFFAARCIGGLGCGIIQSNTPIYMSEIAPPHSRGMLVGFHPICIVFAEIIASACALGFNSVKASYQWRLNFGIQTFFGVVLLVSLYFLPESPRWLMENRRESEASDILRRLHHSKDDPSDIVARAEITQIRSQIEAERESSSSWITIFREPHLRKRAICTLLVWTMGMNTGITVISNLTPTLFAGLGYSPVLQLGLGLVFCVCLLVGVFFGIAIVDRVGRRVLLIGGGIGSSVLFIIEAVLQKYYIDGHSESGLKATVAIYFIFGFWYLFTFEPAAFVYGPEIWPTHLRNQGAQISYFGFFIGSVWTVASAPQGLANLGWKYYMIFVAATVPCIIACYFLLPETAGLTLEEIGKRFGDKVEIDFNTALQNQVDGGSKSLTDSQTIDKSSKDEKPQMEHVSN